MPALGLHPSTTAPGSSNNNLSAQSWPSAQYSNHSASKPNNTHHKNGSNYSNGNVYSEDPPSQYHINGSGVTSNGSSSPVENSIDNNRFTNNLSDNQSHIITNGRNAADLTNGNSSNGNANGNQSAGATNGQLHHNSGLVMSSKQSSPLDSIGEESSASSSPPIRLAPQTSYLPFKSGCKGGLRSDDTDNTKKTTVRTPPNKYSPRNGHSENSKNSHSIASCNGNGNINDIHKSNISSIRKPVSSISDSNHHKKSPPSQNVCSSSNVKTSQCNKTDSLPPIISSSEQLCNCSSPDTMDTATSSSEQPMAAVAASTARPATDCTSPGSRPTLTSVASAPCFSSPTSYSGVSESAGAWGELGHYNILHVTTRDPGQHWFTRYCCYVTHCYRLKVKFPYPAIQNKMILSDDRIQTALEQVVGESEGRNSALMQGHVKRAHTILNNMKAAISTTLIRLTGYVLFKVFSGLLKSVVVHKGQLEAIQRASKRGTPLIFVPLHRSHVDYLFVTWVLFNCQIPAPIVAAGDNLNMPVFGALLRGTGGFFIKRRLESNKARRDVLYRALLQCYMSHSLHAGYNLEFFIEGGRTRTGKPAMPKGGLLSVIVDAYLSGMLNDAMIVPVAINYDKIVDGNFIREQLGQSKVPESFWGAVGAICKVLSTNYGQSRIDFGAPFSLQEFVQRSHTPPPAPAAAVVGGSKGHHRSLSTPVSNNVEHLTVRRVPSGEGSDVIDASQQMMHPAMSNSSLFGSELTDEFRELVNKLGRHIVFDAERCQAMMSSNLLSWLLCFVHRDGATLATLSDEVTELRELLHLRGRDVGFTGETEHVVKHAVKLLGPGLIKTEERAGGLLYAPVTVLPNVIELNYYANALLPVFVLDAVVATSILSLVQCDLNSYIDCDTNITLELDKVMRCSERLCEIIENEFILVAPCGKLSTKLLDVIDSLQVTGLLTEHKALSKSLRRLQHQDDDTTWDLDNGAALANDAPLYTVVYNVNPTKESMKYLKAFSAMLTPILDAYCTTIETLQILVGKQMSEKEFVKATQDLVRQKLEEGSLIYGESIAADPIKNCLKLLTNDHVIEAQQQEGADKLVSLAAPYDSKDALEPLLTSIHSIRL